MGSTQNVILDTTQYVKVTEDPGSFVLQSHGDTVRIAFHELKPSKSNTAFHELGGQATIESVLETQHVNIPIWVLAMTDRSKLTITRYDSEGVPPEYSKQTANGDTFLIQKGVLNNLRVRPQILNEHAESSRNVQSFVTSTNIVGQIFKASQDNINGLGLTMQSAASVDFDDFESYADSAALQLAWPQTGSGNDAILETTIVYEGTQAMLLDIDDGGSVGDEWERTFASVDFTGYTGQLKLYSNKEYKDIKMRVFIRDSAGNTNSTEIIQSDKDIWTDIIIDIAGMVADGGTRALDSDIVGIGFRVEKEKKDGYVILDELVSVPGPGSIDIKLWDMGTSIPTSGVTALDDGTQYEKLGDLGITGQQVSSVNIDLSGGKRNYHIDRFVAGVAKEIPTNELLIPNHYYAITIHYVDTNTSVYGPNEAWDDYYINGYAFNAPDESTAITALGSQKDIMFVVYSTQDVYVNRFVQVADAKPGSNSVVTVYVEDENMKRTDQLFAGIRGLQQIDRIIDRPFFMPKGAKLEEEYTDDFTDDVSDIVINFQYYFIPPIVNG